MSIDMLPIHAQCGMPITAAVAETGTVTINNNTNIQRLAFMGAKYLLVK